MPPTLRSVTVLVLSGALAACHPGAGTTTPGPAGQLWPVGLFEMVADVEYRSEGPSGAATRRVQHRAVLTVETGGVLSLTSTAGGCHVDPRDTRVRNRRFFCDEATYEVEPSGEMVRGTISVRAEIMVRGRRQCIQYQTSSNGTRTCVRWDEPLETRVTQLRENLRVARLEGS